MKIRKEYLLSVDELKEKFPIGSKYIIDEKEVIVSRIDNAMLSNYMASYPMVTFEEIEKM